MKHTSISPFYVGQEVVALVTTRLLKKGKCYIVKAVYPGQCNCAKWLISIGIKEWAEGTRMPCNKCGSYIIRKSETQHPAQLFAPITSTFQSITLEKVLEEETKLIGVN